MIFFNKCPSIRWLDAHLAKSLVGGVVGSWLLWLSPDRAVLFQPLEKVIVLCSCARHLILTVTLSSQVYK